MVLIMAQDETSSNKSLKSLVRSSIELRPSPIHRYGVFASHDISPKEIIEEYPVIICSYLIIYFIRFVPALSG